MIAPNRYSYASVMAALTACFDVALADQSRFAARISFLQKGGLFGPEHRPGKGQHLAYQPDQMNRLVLVCGLAAHGLPPALQLRLVADLWDARLAKIFLDAARVRLMNQPPGGDDVVLFMFGADLWAEAVPNIQSCELRKFPAKVEAAMCSNDPPPRIMAFNVTAVLRRFHTCLADVHLKLPQPPIAAADQEQRHEPDVQRGRRQTRDQKRARRRAKN